LFARFKFLLHRDSVTAALYKHIITIKLSCQLSYTVCNTAVKNISRKIKPQSAVCRAICCSIMSTGTDRSQWPAMFATKTFGWL